MIGAGRNDELGRLVGAMCDGTITADDTGQLDALLTKDEEARRFYNNYMFLHAELYSQHASLEAVEKDGNCGLRIAGLRIGSSETDHIESENPKSEIRNSRVACDCGGNYRRGGGE